MAIVETLSNGIDTEAQIGALSLNLPKPANLDKPQIFSASDRKIIEWLFRHTAKADAAALSTFIVDPSYKLLAERACSPQDDWQTVTSICGHQAADFDKAGVGLPLTAAEIDHFRRNHRETDNLVSHDFLTGKSDLPSPLSELYSLYRHRARLDAEASLFLAQATGSTRVAKIMADLLAIGGFANGHEFITHMTLTYSVPSAFDTSDIIDRANSEATRRLALPIDHPAHLLKLSPDDVSLLATNLVEKHLMSGPDFLEKANLLSEARQDVNRMAADKQFVTAIGERDLPLQEIWVVRICAAYGRIFESWVAGVSELDAILRPASSTPQ